MWLELSGGAAAWLAHLLWYATTLEGQKASPSLVKLRRRALVLASRVLAVATWALAIVLWIHVDGPGEGSCAAFAALTAAASVNTILAPLSRGYLGVAGTGAALALLVGLGESCLAA